MRESTPSLQDCSHHALHVQVGVNKNIRVLADGQLERAGEKARFYSQCQ